MRRLSEDHLACRGESLPNLSAAALSGRSCAQQHQFEVRFYTWTRDRWLGCSGAGHEIRAEARPSALTEALGGGLRLDGWPQEHRSPGDHVEHSRSEEHTSELQSLMRTQYAVCCL